MVIPDIIFRHATEAAFLWLLRDMAVKQPHYSLKDLTRLDDRLEAHLDGLRIAGDEGWEVCKEQLFINEPGEVFTAAVIAFESKKDKRIDQVLEAGIKDQERLRSVTSALGWIEYQDIRQIAESFWFETDPVLQQLGIASAAIHRKDIPDEVLISALNNENIYLKSRALKALGELGKVNMLQYLQNSFYNDIPLVSFTAARSALLLGNTNAQYILKELLNNTDEPYHEEIVILSSRKMNLKDSKTWLSELKNNTEQLRLAIVCAGASGDPFNIPWLIDMMRIDDFSRKAGESFSMITGVDLAYDNLDLRMHNGFSKGPNENPEDENVEMDIDENLPVPDADLVSKWWINNKTGYKNNIRYLNGQPVSPEWPKQVLKTGLQRQRYAAALELVMLSPGEKLFNVKANGVRQKKILNVK
ncbi:MAG: TIGR02270 family protein [Bacillota bacterium]